MDEILNRIKILSNEYGFDPKLIWAFCKKESDFITYATRYEPLFRYAKNENMFVNSGNSFDTEHMFQCTSIGLMQLMGANARVYGYKDKLARLIVDWEICLEFSLMHLRWNKSRFSYQDDMISAWNQGSAKKNSLGQYENQNYVDQVNSFYKNCPITF